MVKEKSENPFFAVEKQQPLQSTRNNKYVYMVEKVKKKKLHERHQEIVDKLIFNISCFFAIVMHFITIIILTMCVCVALCVE